MLMKKIIIPFVLLAASMAFSSCEDFLTKSPETSLSPDTYFTSERELDLWANKFYYDILPEPVPHSESACVQLPRYFCGFL